ncbi:disulfide bond formation protein B [Candidatus Pacearchaeota archaeon]|nr:disulfide bond formation protein B [Candidatus Pacearchaeota archaeon]
MELVNFVTQILSILTIITHIIIVIALILYIITLLTKKKFRFYLHIKNFFQHYSKIFIFIIAVTATFGSLFLSQIAKYTPCLLCWYQRIFMYPIALIALISIIKKDNNIPTYIIPMSIIGGFFAGYHYLITLSAKVSASDICSNNGVSCLIEYFNEFGYVTFPLMSLTAFIIVIILSILLIKHHKITTSF